MTNLKEIRESFLEASSHPQSIPPVKNLLPTRIRNNKQSIYSWMAISDLIGELKKQKIDDFDEDMDRLERFTVRFVVDQHMQLWFALEGQLSSVTPTHSEMVNDEAVYSAGNMVFSQDYETIEEITNKSGHYKPVFSSLVFFIALLLNLEKNPNFPIRIASQLKLVEYQKDCQYLQPILEHFLSKSELESLIPADCQLIANDNYVRIKMRNSSNDSKPSSSYNHATTSDESRPSSETSDFLPPERPSTKKGHFSFFTSINNEPPLGTASFSAFAARKRKESPGSRTIDPPYKTSSGISSSKKPKSSEQPSSLFPPGGIWSGPIAPLELEDPLRETGRSPSPMIK